MTNHSLGSFAQRVTAGLDEQQARLARIATKYPLLMVIPVVNNVFITCCINRRLHHKLPDLLRLLSKISVKKAPLDGNLQASLLEMCRTDDRDTLEYLSSEYEKQNCTIDFASPISAAKDSTDGCIANGSSLLHFASFAGSCEVVAFLVEKLRRQAVNTGNSKGETPLFLACSNPEWDVDEDSRTKSKKVIQILLEKGAAAHLPRTVDRWTPLHVLCQLGNLDAVSLLCGHVVKAGWISTYDILNAKDTSGKNPLHIATENRQSGVVRELLQNYAGKYPKWEAWNEQDKAGQTPFQIACSSASEEICRLYVDAKETLKLDVNKPFADGNRPLHVAALARHLSLVKYLLQQGADPCKTNANRTMPSQLESSSSVMTLLTDAVNAKKLGKDAYESFLKERVERIVDTTKLDQYLDERQGNRLILDEQAYRQKRRDQRRRLGRINIWRMKLPDRLRNFYEEVRSAMNASVVAPALIKQGWVQHATSEEAFWRMFWENASVDAIGGTASVGAAVVSVTTFGAGLVLCTVIPAIVGGIKALQNRSINQWDRQKTLERIRYLGELGANSSDNEWILAEVAFALTQHQIDSLKGVAKPDRAKWCSEVDGIIGDSLQQIFSRIAQQEGFRSYINDPNAIVNDLIKFTLGMNDENVQDLRSRLDDGQQEALDTLFEVRLGDEDSARFKQAFKERLSEIKKMLESIVISQRSLQTFPLLSKIATDYRTLASADTATLTAQGILEQMQKANNLKWLLERERSLHGYSIISSAELYYPTIQMLPIFMQLKITLHGLVLLQPNSSPLEEAIDVALDLLKDVVEKCTELNRRLSIDLCHTLARVSSKLEDARFRQQQLAPSWWWDTSCVFPLEDETDESCEHVTSEHLGELGEGIIRALTELSVPVTPLSDFLEEEKLLNEESQPSGKTSISPGKNSSAIFRQRRSSDMSSNDHQNVVGVGPT